MTSGAALLVGLGIFLHIAVGSEPSSPGSLPLVPGPAGSGGNALVEGQESPGVGSLPWDEDGLEDGEGGGSWSPTFLRGGFGFFVGFCIGFALRQFIRLAVILAGAQLILLSYLAIQGWIDVRWDVMEQSFESLTANLGAQLESLKTFLQGSLPSLGLAGLGIYTGLKKN